LRNVIQAFARKDMLSSDQLCHKKYNVITAQINIAVQSVAGCLAKRKAHFSENVWFMAHLSIEGCPQHEQMTRSTGAGLSIAGYLLGTESR
jgi:hypothetical protein